MSYCLLESYRIDIISMTGAEESVLFLNHIQNLLSQCHLHDTICRNILLGYSWERSPPTCGWLYLMILVTRLDRIGTVVKRLKLYNRLIVNVIENSYLCVGKKNTSNRPRKAEFGGIAKINRPSSHMLIVHRAICSLPIEPYAHRPSSHMLLAEDMSEVAICFSIHSALQVSAVSVYKDIKRKAV